MEIIEAGAADLDRVLEVEKTAFGSDEEAELVRKLLLDETAKPLLSLLALEAEKAVGHILFTNAGLTGSAAGVRVSILAPLAVIPEAQNTGIGGRLIEEGLRLLKEQGGELVFVLGHPGYYPRHGFQPAGALGLDAPYPIPENDADAWMVRELRPGILGTVSGKVVCAEKLDQPEYWAE
jgi:putative acetyltransferase